MFQGQAVRFREGTNHQHLDVSENSGTPKSSILIGFSIINHPFWGTPIFGNTHLGFLLSFMGLGGISAWESIPRFSIIIHYIQGDPAFNSVIVFSSFNQQEET